jgi:hypothetical protein
MALAVFSMCIVRPRRGCREGSEELEGKLSVGVCEACLKNIDRRFSGPDIFSVSCAEKMNRDHHIVGWMGMLLLALLLGCGRGNAQEVADPDYLLISLIERITSFDYQSMDTSKGFPYFWRTDDNWKNVKVFKEGLEQELLINVNFCKDVETAKRLFDREWRGFARGTPPHKANDMVIFSPSRGKYGYILFRDRNVLYEVLTEKWKEESSFDDIVDLIACIASRNEHDKKTIEGLIEALKKDKSNREEAERKKKRGA